VIILQIFQAKYLGGNGQGNDQTYDCRFEKEFHIFFYHTFKQRTQ